MDNLKQREYFRNHVPNAGSFPCANKFYQNYLAEVIAKHVQSTKFVLAEYNSISIVADEAKDAHNMYILHFLFVPVSWKDDCMPVCRSHSA